ncbi:MAG: hypothetical protein V4710_05390 [Verrucomicrobiota bacterium]
MSAPEINASHNRQSSEREGELIDKEELRRRLSLPSTRMVDQLVRRRKIPFLRLGHRTVRLRGKYRISAPVPAFLPS